MRVASAMARNRARDSAVGGRKEWLVVSSTSLSRGFGRERRSNWKARPRNRQYDLADTDSSDGWTGGVVL